ncbi:MAG: hypothetical protein ACR2HJ_01435 [Fimbriimonadales bacterium]
MTQAVVSNFRLITWPKQVRQFVSVSVAANVEGEFRQEGARLAGLESRNLFAPGTVTRRPPNMQIRQYG